MKPSTNILLIFGGLAVLFLLYQTKVRGVVVYIVALAIYGLVVVNFQTIQSQMSDTFHPDKRATK